MTHIYYHPGVLEHDTGSHPEHARRMQAIVKLFDANQLWGSDRIEQWPAADIEQAAAVHDADYLASVRQLAQQGGGRVDADTVVSPASFDVALLAAGAAIDAVKRVVTGPLNQAFCLVRPPGHHAVRSRAMGFCLINNVAVAAQAALDQHHLERVLIVDWDVHHGNGTQDLFYDDPRVAFFSAHRWPFYPGTGAADETGAGDGLGATLNLPMKFGVSRDRYLAEFARTLGDFADRFCPQLVLVSAGFDAHRLDPVGSLGLETEDFESLTAAVQDVAATHAAGRLVSVLEGGYDPPTLAECAEVHLGALREREAT